MGKSKSAKVYNAVYLGTVEEVEATRAPEMEPTLDNADIPNPKKAGKRKGAARYIFVLFIIFNTCSFLSSLSEGPSEDKADVSQNEQKENELKGNCVE